MKASIVVIFCLVAYVVCSPVKRDVGSDRALPCGACFPGKRAVTDLVTGLESTVQETANGLVGGGSEPKTANKRAVTDLVSGLLPVNKRAVTDVVSGLLPVNKRAVTDVVGGVESTVQEATNGLLGGGSEKKTANKRAVTDLVTGLLPVNKRAVTDVVGGLLPVSK